MDLPTKAALLRRLHLGPEILVLPNAWDAASARIFEQAGFPALATTSAGIAFAHGYPDGERISRNEMLDAVRRIAAAVQIPLTADMEAGYGPSIADAEETAHGVLAAGAVGLNFEDAREGRLLDAAVYVERLRAMRRVADDVHVPLVINARTDMFLLGVGAAETRLAETIRRANLYCEAGADCVFVPGVREAEAIDQLVRAIRGPLNILAGPGVPSAAALQQLGVARVSTGSGPVRASMSFAQRLAIELRNTGTYGAFSEGAIAYAEANRLMEQ